MVLFSRNKGGKSVNEDGFKKLFWGFLFIMIDFRIMGFDILPDVVGYIFFALGLTALISNSAYFSKARSVNIPMIILSLFSIYQRQAQNNGFSAQLFVGYSSILGIFFAIASIVLDLLTVYYIFMGIKDMADKCEQIEIFSEADRRWNQYLLLTIAIIFVFVLIFIPPLALIYVIGLLVANIVLAIKIMQFMNKCGKAL